MNSRTERARDLLAALTLALLWSGEAYAEGQPEATATLVVVVENVGSESGAIVIALTNSAEQFESGDAFFRSDAAVAIYDGRAERTFEGVPLGTYAAKIFHDENTNGDLDTNWVGYPTEGFGFSNDAMGRFGPPTFDEAAFEVDDDPTRITVTIR